MKTLPSTLFPNCKFSGDDDVGFYDITPKGFDHPVSLYLGHETVKDDAAITKAGTFFDQLPKWDRFCRDTFASVEEGSEDHEMVMEYFNFYRDEVPEVFNVSDASELSLKDMVKCLILNHMGTNGNGLKQNFNVDFTLGCDQLLSAYFDGDGKLDHIAWES